MELKITSEKVLEAASKCSTAKETLKTLFPEVFNSTINLWDSSSICGLELFMREGDRERSLIAIRAGDDSSFWLNPDYNWELKFNYLTPTKK